MTRAERISIAVSVLSLIVSMLALLYTTQSDRRKEAEAQRVLSRNAFLLGSGLTKVLRVEKQIDDYKASAIGAPVAKLIQGNKDLELGLLRSHYDNLVLSAGAWNATRVWDLIDTCGKQIDAKYAGETYRYYDLAVALGKFFFFYEAVPASDASGRLKKLRTAYSAVRSAAAAANVQTSAAAADQPDTMFAEFVELESRVHQSLGYSKFSVLGKSAP